MKNIFPLKKEDAQLLGVSIMLALIVMAGFYVKHAFGVAETLDVTINSTIDFTLHTNDFPALTPGSPVFASTTMSMTTNNTAGWNVTLSGDEKTNSVPVFNSSGGDPGDITDATQWIIDAAAATTTAGNAAAITSGDDVLAFRVMSGSGSAPFLSTSWWGTSDVQFNASQLWGGIASPTGVSRIGNAGTGSYQAGAHLNTVQYYLDVPASQQTGAYTGPLTYTATAN